jgi:hypothetical protein|tara:strand:+ start:1066 stop:1281 length:216 start_codon:yes stop_codon:yes gene_type:complete
MAVEYIGSNGPDGMCFGTGATEKIAFFGSTPVIQQAMTAVGTTTATTALNETKIDRLITALSNLGLVTTGG